MPFELNAGRSLLAFDEPELHLHPALLVPPETRTLASITIVGGAYHEVRRIFAALGSHVAGLCRVRFGTFDLPPDLPAGGWRSLPVPSPP